MVAFSSSDIQRRLAAELLIAEEAQAMIAFCTSWAYVQWIWLLVYSIMA
jgi:hypothetical protein